MNIDEGTCKPYLKLDNEYYYQVQGQMAITGIEDLMESVQVFQ